MSKTDLPGICQRIIQIRLEATGPRGKASFSKLLGISPSTYEYYEGGRVPPAHLLIKISAVANIDLKWLLTGQESAQGGGADLAIARPILRRISALLDDNPRAVKALTAFVDLLSKSLEFSAKDLAAGDSVSTPEATSKLTSSPSSLVEVAGAVATQSPTPAGTDHAVIDAATREHAVAGDIATTAECGLGENAAAQQQAGWLPVLGRSAAGVPQFWSGKDLNQTLTTLDELIARHAVAPASQTAPALALADQTISADPMNVQVITLADPAPGQPGQFLVAETIKNRYPDAFAVQIDGNSMSPEIEHGDFVILSPSVNAEDGRAAVIQLTGQIGVTCKLLRQAGDLIHLIPINEQFAPQPFPAASVVWALRVLARVRA